jgi:hypothetical protein
LDTEYYGEWVGLKFFHPVVPGGPVGLLVTLEAIEGVGAHQVVYRVIEAAGERTVIKFPRNHLGFVIGLPPDLWFPLLHGDSGYESKLTSRLLSLGGSPLLADICPLDGLWTTLAVQYLPGSRTTDGPRLDELTPAVARSSFIRDRLLDWSLLTKCDTDDPLMVLYAGAKPIYSTFRSMIAHEAQAGLELYYAASHQCESPVRDVRFNPWLPWIAALATGYSLSDDAVPRIASAIEATGAVGEIFDEARVVVKYCLRGASRLERLMTADLFLRVLSKCLDRE